MYCRTKFANVIDVGVGDFRDVYHAGGTIRQRDERAELAQTLDLAFHNCSNCKIHMFVLFSHFILFKTHKRRV